MTIANIANACNGTVYGTTNYTTEETQVLARGVVIDSRKVEKDFVFIATKGERVDGHSFIAPVFDKGALAVICEELPAEPTGPCILVEDSFQALKDVAEFYRQQLDIKVVGITGSVGKTSTKGFVASVLEQKYLVHKTEGNFNNEVGVPLTVLQIKEEHEVAVLEMGINHFGEMHRLSKIARPDICVLTNIGACHLEFLEDLDGVLRAKSEIFDFMNADGTVCVNGDDRKLSQVVQIHGKEVISFGFFNQNQVYASDLENKGLLGSEAMIHIGNEANFVARIPLPGEHMVYNALAATAVGRILGLSAAEIAKGIGAAKAVSGRSNIVEVNRMVLIDDCYNANPVSMKAAINLLCTAATRKVAILGDMFELGEEEVKLHKEVGAYAKTQAIDVMVCIGELSKAMYEAEVIANKEVYYFQTKEKFMEEIKSIVKETDTILLKASHGMGFDKIVDFILKSYKKE